MSDEDNRSLKEQFYAATQSHLVGRDELRDRESWERIRRIHATPVSRAESNALKKALDTPTADLALEPDGAVQVRIRERVTVEMTRRIHFIEKRLRRVDGMTRDHFERNR